MLLVCAESNRNSAFGIIFPPQRVILKQCFWDHLSAPKGHTSVRTRPGSRQALYLGGRIQGDSPLVTFLSGRTASFRAGSENCRKRSIDARALIGFAM